MPTQLDLPESFQHEAAETPLLAEQAPSRPRRTLTLVGGDARQAAIEAAAAAMQEPEDQAEEPVEEEPTGWIPPRTWRQLEAVDLEAELQKPVRTVREPPRWFRGSLCRAFNIALRKWEMTPNASTWKLVVLLPRMLLRPTEELGEAGKDIFKARMRKFLQGEWIDLLDEAAASLNESPKPGGVSDNKTFEAAEQRRLQQAEAKIRMREVSRARVLLSSQGLAPGDANTLAELTNPELRPTHLSKELPADAMAFVPPSPLNVDPDKILAALRSAGRGSAQDLSGSRYEHYRVLIEDGAAWGLFAKFVQAFARGDVPDEIAQALRLGRMTALRKDNG